MANQADRIAARDRRTAEQRVRQVHQNRGVPVGANFARQVARYMQDPNYIDTIRWHADQAATRTSPTAPTAPATPTPTQDTLTAPPTNTFDYRSAARALYPWLTNELLSVFAEYWSSTGDPNLALAHTRQSPSYKSMFPGIFRDDGTMRMDENAYFRTVNDYKTIFARYGIQNVLGNQHIIKGIQNDVGAPELADRFARVYTRILSAGNAVRQEVARLGMAGDVSDAAIFASFVDPTISIPEAERRITTAEIAGEARTAGFLRTLPEIQRLAQHGLNLEAARRFFSQARTQLPTLSTLVQRHNDPDDTFDLGELEDAVVFTNPDQMQRLERLFGQEAALFSPVRMFQRTREGAVEGLRQR